MSWGGSRPVDPRADGVARRRVTVGRRAAVAPLLGAVAGLSVAVTVIAIGAASLAGALPTRAAAQDIEALAEMRGIELPASYYRTIERTPGIFQLPNGLFRADARGPPLRATAEGTARVPVVLALFSDSEDPYPDFHEDEIARVLFDGPAPRGTITEAFEEMSLGRFGVEGDVFPWVRTSKPMMEVVGTDNGFGADADLGSYFLEALDSVDGGVDFGLYDSDGPDGVPNSGDDDGIVDALVFEFLEIAGSCGGPSIWPHRSGLRFRTEDDRPYQTDDASAHPEKDVIEIDGYITQGVTDCAGEGLQSANVITHEYGHVLGLPDYYHWVDRNAGPRGRRWVLGCWGLMAAGSWGCGDVEEEGELREPFGPTHMSAQSKAELGWVDLVDPGEVWNEEIVLEPIQTSGVGLGIPLDEAGRELLLVEYRGRTGFDAQLPAAGVVFYKLDLDAGLYPDPDSDQPYRLTLLERDGDRGLLRMALEGGDRGVAGDAWGIGQGGGKLTFHSTPRLSMSDGGYAPAMVHEVHVEGAEARIVLSTGETPMLVAPPEPFEVMRIRTFAVPARIAGGRGPYTGVGELPAGFWLEAFGDELFLMGSYDEIGPHQLGFAVRDADGDESEPIAVEVTASIEWVVEIADLVEHFLDDESDAVTPGERVHLDELGNDNGQYDVGDLRRWLRENG